jgi:hypothetical protein
MMVPCMLGWMLQLYWYVPGVLNVKLNDCPVAKLPELNADDTTVCVTESLLVQVTVVPADTVRDAGLKAKLLMLTALVWLVLVVVFVAVFVLTDDRVLVFVAVIALVQPETTTAKIRTPRIKKSFFFIQKKPCKAIPPSR